QRRSLPQPLRSPGASLVLPADPARRSPARLSPAGGGTAVSALRGTGSGPAAPAGVGLRTPRGRLVRALLFPVRLPAGDVRPPGVSVFRAGAGPRRGVDGSSPDAVVRSRADGRLHRADAGSSGGVALVCAVSFALRPGGGSDPAVWRFDDARGLLPALVR